MKKQVLKFESSKVIALLTILILNNFILKAQCPDAGICNLDSTLGNIQV